MADPIVLASDRSSGTTADVLNCVNFETDFRNLDKNGNSSLSYDEATPYLTSGINEYLVNNNVMDPKMAFYQADISGDGELSLPEWHIFRNFWAPVHVSNVGPRQASNNGQVATLSDGPLGGFFYDSNLIAVFMTNSVNMLLEQYTYSTCCSCSCSCNGNCTCNGDGGKQVCGNFQYPPCNLADVAATAACEVKGFCNATRIPACSDVRVFTRTDGSNFSVLNYADPCDPNCAWDSSFVRESTTSEAKRVLSNWDLDGSGRVSVEEHYFRLFADANSDGLLSPAEYAAALYPAGGFADHDLNGDGNVTFIERKFKAGEVLGVRIPGLTSTTASGRRRFGTRAGAGVLAGLAKAMPGLTRQAWNAADFPSDFGSFDSHAQELKASSTTTELMQGLSGEVLVQQLGFSHYAILFQCAMQAMLMYQVPLSQHPWVASCPIVVYLPDAEPWVKLTPSTTGLSRGASGYMVEMWELTASRLMWSSTYNTSLATKGPEALDSAMTEPPIRGPEFGRMNIALFAGWHPLNSTQYLCSRSFAPSLDGLATVVRSNPPSLSLIVAVVGVLPEYSFINLISFLIVVLFGVGHLFWYLERNENSEQFNPSYFKGMIDSAWFLLVASSTIGYGDKAPVTGMGKMLAFFWLFFGVLMFSVFLGTVMSNITTQVAESKIDGPGALAGFTVGVLGDDATRSLQLDSVFQFSPKYCANVSHCVHMLYDTKEVSALMVPYADLVTTIVTGQLSTIKCGNPVRVVGDPVFADVLPSLRVCLVGELLYAAKYIVDAVQNQLDVLAAEGTAASLQTDVVAAARAGGGGGCVDSSFDFNLIGACIAVIGGYIVLITLDRERLKIWRAQKAAEQADQGYLTEPPAVLAFKYGKMWRDRAMANKGGVPGGADVVVGGKREEDMGPEETLSLMLRKVGTLNRGVAHDLRRLKHEVEVFDHAGDGARWLARFCVLVMVSLGVGLLYSLTAVRLNAEPKYIIPS